MSGRIINLTLSMAPIVRTDRALLAQVDAYGPLRDEDALQIDSIDTWPACGGMVMDGLALGNYPVIACDFDDFIWWSGAGHGMYLIAGITKDSVGAPVAGVNVDLYRTLDDALVLSVVSDSIGKFACPVNDNTTAYYVRCWRLSPPIQGTSVDTLVGQAYPE